MSENNTPVRQKSTTDWLVRGVLTKIGDSFDRLTGRGWKPSSNLATSELTEKLKQLLDSEARVDQTGKKVVPHHINLKIQWDKFSTDSEKSIKALETELLTAAVDHINDKVYYTYAPLSLTVKPDYFTAGVKLFVSFEKFVEDQTEAELNVSVQGMTSDSLLQGVDQSNVLPDISATAVFILNGITKRLQLTFEHNNRLTVGRTKENDLAIDDTSVSKMHASLLLDGETKILVADTGSTNGTFIAGQRIPYGKAISIESGQSVKFGTVNVEFFMVKRVQEENLSRILPETEAMKIGDFEFSSRLDATAIERPNTTTSGHSIPRPVSEFDEDKDVQEPQEDFSNEDE